MPAKLGISYQNSWYSFRSESRLSQRAGNQLPELLIFFLAQTTRACPCWESVTRTLDILCSGVGACSVLLGISYQNSWYSFELIQPDIPPRWESVTRTLDILCSKPPTTFDLLGISYQNSWYSLQCEYLRECHAGNQLPELLIFFNKPQSGTNASWESVTRTLDILWNKTVDTIESLGISYQNSWYSFVAWRSHSTYAGNQLPELLIFFSTNPTWSATRWESVTRTLDILWQVCSVAGNLAGNQLPELLIFFRRGKANAQNSWESVTRTLDILSRNVQGLRPPLGISYQNSWYSFERLQDHAPVAGNQLPELLIFFTNCNASRHCSWESVTRTLDILSW